LPRTTGKSRAGKLVPVIAAKDNPAMPSLLPDWLEDFRARLGAEVIETHISWLLLTGAFAWKLKKPITLPFLDYGTLARREAFCRAELVLNHRLAPELYLDVVPIGGTPEQPRLGTLPAI
jgi:aminoglycoside phosphotransferase family enzyme